MSEINKDILTQAINDVIAECGKINLAEIERRLSISRGKLRVLQKHGFDLDYNGKKGKKKQETKISSFSSIIDEDYLKKGITNSQVIFDAIKKMGYEGGLTGVKTYIKEHLSLVPAPRVLKINTPNRGMRYETEGGELYQMDWGFVKVVNDLGNQWQCACFAMVCHHCGLRYIEFFPSARQENLFIGMLHAFSYMGVPKKVYTDNMKSVVIKRLRDGSPILNKDYEAFQTLIGFETVLHKVAHPWSKGKVERLVRYVKGNFIQGRSFSNITELNNGASAWCYEKNSKTSRTMDIPPIKEHFENEKLSKLPKDDFAIQAYLAPIRKISYDGYVNYENRLYGVPMAYSGKNVRVRRDGDTIKILTLETYETIYTYTINWNKKPNTCVGQWSIEPEEKPTTTVTSFMPYVPPKRIPSRFERFAKFGRRGE